MHPEHVTRTPTNGSVVLLSRVSVCIMSPVYWNVIQREFWSRDMDVYLTHIRFGIILTRFMSISRDRNIRQMSYRYRSSPEILRYQPTPFHISFTVPLNTAGHLQLLQQSHFKIFFICCDWFLFLCKHVTYLFQIIYHERDCKRDFK